MMPGRHRATSLGIGMLLLLTAACNSSHRYQCRRCIVRVTLTVRQVANDSIISEEHIVSPNYYKDSFRDSIMQLIYQRQAAGRTVGRRDSLLDCQMEDGLSAAAANDLEPYGWVCEAPY